MTTPSSPANPPQQPGQGHEAQGASGEALGPCCHQSGPSDEFTIGIDPAIAEASVLERGKAWWAFMAVGIEASKRGYVMSETEDGWCFSRTP